jgi:small subunit ribosomal protein S12
MTTIYQTQTYRRIPKESHHLCTALKLNPQVKGRVVKQLSVTPRKPNSAIRKIFRVRLVNKKVISTKLAGSGKFPLKFATVLVKGRGYKDTPSIKYQIMRGIYDCPTFYNINRKRSLYVIKAKYLIYIKKSDQKKTY